MTRPIADQVVVVTGASYGIGRAIARAFAARGARLGLLARNKEALENAADEVRRAGGEALACAVDVADAEAVERAAAAFEERFGRIDTWVNDAMVTVLSPVKEMTPDEYRRVTDVTYLGTVHGTLAALRRMLPPRRGDDHPDRLRPRLQLDPPPKRLLRGQSCHPGVYRFPADGAAPR